MNSPLPRALVRLMGHAVALDVPVHVLTGNTGLARGSGYVVAVFLEHVLPVRATGGVHGVRVAAHDCLHLTNICRGRVFPTSSFTQSRDCRTVLSIAVIPAMQARSSSIVPTRLK
jgi:hypothetical protein